MRGLRTAAVVLLAAVTGFQTAQGAGDAATTATLPLDNGPAPPAALAPLAAAFRSEAAWRLLVEQVGYGPRVCGTAAHARCIAMIERELKEAGFEVELREGPAFTPELTKQTVPVTNIIARWHTERARRLFFSAHYDSRPVSDQAKDPRERAMPVPGANDGASGVAVLLEMARAIKVHPPRNVGVFLVFHDAEDLGVSRGTRTSDPLEEYARGAAILAEEWSPDEAFQAGVNLDMVGDRHLQYKIEGYSQHYAGDVVARFWGIGARLYPTVFMNSAYGMIMDDHLPYLNRKLPCIDLIDFDFPEWHTPRDLPAACLPSSLRITGNTALEFIAEADQAGADWP